MAYAGTKRTASKRASISTPAAKKLKLAETTPVTTPTLSKDSSRAASTPVADAPPAPPPPKVQKLPTRTYESRPLPSLPQKQSLDLSANEYQSIAASAVLSAALQRSRLRWIHDGFFQRYWVKPETGKHAKPPPPNNPDVKWMKSKGPCRIRVEPHVFEVDVYVEEKAKPPPPPKQYHPPVKAQPLPYGQAYRPGIQPQSFAPKHNLNARPPAAHVSSPAAVQPHRPLPPGSAHPVPPPQQRPQPQSFTARPPAPPPASQQDKKSTPDPVISMLAARASSDPELKGLMKEVATGHASMEQLRVFQRHIDELTAIIQKQKRADGVQSAPKPGATIAPGSAASSQVQPAQPTTPLNPAAQSRVQPALQTAPQTVTHTTPSHNATLSQLPAQSKPISQSPAVQTSAPQPLAQSTQPLSQNPTQSPGQPQALRQTQAQPQLQQTVSARPPIPPSQNLAQPQAQPLPPAQPRYQAAPPAVRPPPQQLWTPPAPAALPVIMAFTSAGATEDRFLFPQHSILESLSPQHTLASFIVTKKGREAIDAKDLEPDIEYWQPVTIMVEVAYGREEILRCIQRWVKPADAVRTHMQEIMDRCTRAPETYLAMRLPLRGSAAAEYEDPALLRDATPDEKVKKERRPYTKRKDKIQAMIAAGAAVPSENKAATSEAAGGGAVPALQPAEAATTLPAATGTLPDAATVGEKATVDASNATPVDADPSGPPSAVPEKTEKVVGQVEAPVMPSDTNKTQAAVNEASRPKRVSRKSVRISEGDGV